MATETQVSHYERINDIKWYIRVHQDESLNREVLAQIAGFSVAHFHRIFTAHVGENITAYVRRVRMERAAQRLRDGIMNVTEIAFGAPNGRADVIVCWHVDNVDAVLKKAIGDQPMKSESHPITFQTTIRQHGNNTGIPVPDEVVEQLGSGKRPLVRVTLKSYTYRSAIARMGHNYLISLSAAHRQAANVQGGEAVAVTVELDLEPRTVEIPEDLKSALSEAGALEVFEGSAPSKKKEFVRQVESAKAQATRERRISKIIETLQRQ